MLIAYPLQGHCYHSFACAAGSGVCQPKACMTFPEDIGEIITMHTRQLESVVGSSSWVHSVLYEAKYLAEMASM